MSGRDFERIIVVHNHTVVRQSGLLSWILEQYPTRLFRMRDLVVEEDLCQAGWEKWESKRISNKDSKGKKIR